MLDCIIIGGGVAAVSAALTLQANGKTFEILGGSSFGAKIKKAEMINNYPGLCKVSGEQFFNALKSQLDEMQIEVKPQKATGVYAMKGKFLVTAEGDLTIEGKTVILCTGVESVKPIAGEEEFLGRGVSYCATCDGMLYKDKTIAVLCTTKSLEHEIEYLAKIAKKVYLIPLYKGVEIDGENIEKIVKMPERIEGGLKANAVVFKADKNGEQRTVSVDGVFMLKESVSPAALCGGLQTEKGHIVVKRDQSTNLKGLCAAGDCTGKPYQYAKAIGEGNIAAHSVVEYLAGK